MKSIVSALFLVFVWDWAAIDIGHCDHSGDFGGFGDGIIWVVDVDLDGDWLFWVV